MCQLDAWSYQFTVPHSGSHKSPRPCYGWQVRSDSLPLYIGEPSMTISPELRSRHLEQIRRLELESGGIALAAYAGSAVQRPRLVVAMMYPAWTYFTQADHPHRVVTADHVLEVTPLGEFVKSLLDDPNRPPETIFDFTPLLLDDSVRAFLDSAPVTQNRLLTRLAKHLGSLYHNGNSLARYVGSNASWQQGGRRGYQDIFARARADAAEAASLATQLLPLFGTPLLEIGDGRLPELPVSLERAELRGHAALTVRRIPADLSARLTEAHTRNLNNATAILRAFGSDLVEWANGGPFIPLPDLSRVTGPVNRRGEPVAELNGQISANERPASSIAPRLPTVGATPAPAVEEPEEFEDLKF